MIKEVYSFFDDKDDDIKRLLPKTKKEKILNLTTLRDYILDYFPDLLWWDGVRKHEKFNKNYSYKHRQGMPNEIRIEFDSSNIEENFLNTNLTAVELIKLNYSFAIYYVEGGRSPHIHIYGLDELESLSFEQRIQYRKMFLKKVCPKDSVVDFNLCDEKHLCALEFVNHFKYNKPKELLHYFDNGFNMLIDFDIKIKLLDVVKEKKTIDINQKKLNFGDTLRLKPTQIVMNLLNFETVFDKYNVKYKGTMALCPFHNDTNFSLSFSNDKGLWHCFGCELSGNIIQLIKFLEEKNDKRKDLSCDTRK